MSFDVVYPYGWGIYQEKIPPSDQLVSEFLSNDCDFSVFEGKTTPDRTERTRSVHQDILLQREWVWRTRTLYFILLKIKKDYIDSGLLGIGLAD